MPNSDAIDKTYESLSDEERSLLEKKKVRDHLIYLYLQIRQAADEKKIKESVKALDRPEEQTKKSVSNEIKRAVPNYPARKYYSFSQLSEAASALDKHLDAIEPSEKDAAFFAIRKNLADIKEKAEVMNKLDRPLTDNERNSLRQELAELSRNCKNFAEGEINGREKNQATKEAAKQIKNFAEAEKQKIRDAEKKEIDDFNAHMNVLVDCCQKLNKIKMFLTQAGIRKDDAANTPITETITPKQLGTQLNTLMEIAKIADKKNQPDLRKQADENAHAIMDYLHRHPDILKESGLNKESLKEINRVFKPAKQLQISNK